MNLLKTLIFMAIAPATVTIYLPYALLSSSRAPQPGSLRYLGLLPILAGAVAECWCAWDFAVTGRGTPAPFDPPKELVARGLYRHVRNPMYVAVMSILAGEALFFASRTLAVYALIVFVCFNLFVLLYEEPTLRRKFGESYERYCRAVPRWLPLLKAGGGAR
ncbi:MAG: isoprenylcysteine carboxylmethyltransferase family protein [Acidobacteria bacterium]|nr:isoprenylcysteine carboxylmethyltransferase family protein [Acidobacteriota bacterium]MCA1640745.1 isoprenylcysteine carboxylmethyltransferase family protein [Acidobacteriota bacterium]